eukprot:10503161-Alexandrium_andersonii.AAC.1
MRSNGGWLRESFADSYFVSPNTAEVEGLWPQRRDAKEADDEGEDGGGSSAQPAKRFKSAMPLYMTEHLTFFKEAGLPWPVEADAKFTHVRPFVATR